MQQYLGTEGLQTGTLEGSRLTLAVEGREMEGPGFGHTQRKRSRRRHWCCRQTRKGTGWGDPQMRSQEAPAMTHLELIFIQLLRLMLLRVSHTVSPPVHKLCMEGMPPAKRMPGTYQQTFQQAQKPSGRCHCT